MNKKTQMPTEEILKNIQEFAKESKFEIIEDKDLFEELSNIRKNSLNKIIAEEIPLIIKQDLLFFKRNSINLPRDHEEYLFNLYYKQGEEALKKVYWTTKIFFREFSYLLEYFPDSQELNQAIRTYKNIISGNFLN